MVFKIVTLAASVVLCMSVVDAEGFDIFQHWKHEDAVFPGIVDPPIERLVKKRVVPQWYIAIRNGALKFGSDSQINGNDIAEPLRVLLKIKSHDSREILILNTVRGNELGNNWVKELNPLDKSSPVKIPWHVDADFWENDVQQFLDRIGDEFQPIRSRVRIVNIAYMSPPRFRDILYSDSHVILGFSFGWNDRAFRYYLELPPVTSRVDPTQL